MELKRYNINEFVLVNSEFHWYVAQKKGKGTDTVYRVSLRKSIRRTRKSVQSIFYYKHVYILIIMSLFCYFTILAVSKQPHIFALLIMII